MAACATNSTFQEIISSLAQFSSAQNPLLLESKTKEEIEVDTSAFKWKNVLSVPTFAELEIATIPKVECVFVDQSDTEYRITTVINERDRVLRESIYEREKLIAKEYPGVNFDFRVISRMGHKLEDIATLRCRALGK